jgi:hypothetical protein
MMDRFEKMWAKIQDMQAEHGKSNLKWMEYWANIEDNPENIKPSPNE